MNSKCDIQVAIADGNVYELEAEAYELYKNFMDIDEFTEASEISDIVNVYHDAIVVNLDEMADVGAAITAMSTLWESRPSLRLVIIGNSVNLAKTMELKNVSDRINTRGLDMLGKVRALAKVLAEMAEIIIESTLALGRQMLEKTRDMTKTAERMTMIMKKTKPEVDTRKTETRKVKLDMLVKRTQHA